MRKLLLLSVLLNATLVGVIGYAFRQPVPPSAPRDAEHPPDLNSALGPTEKPARRATKKVHMGIDHRGIHSWRDIEAADYKVYIANLQRIGCPEETIADIIISEVNEMFRGRLAQLPKPPKREYHYWDTETDWRKFLEPRLDPETEKVYRQIQEEKDALLKELLGPDYARHVLPDKSVAMLEHDPFFGGLAPEKRGLVLDAKLRFETAKQRLMDHRGSYMDEDDFKEIARLSNERDDTLKTVLTPDEYNEFTLRFSDQAEQLRRSLLGFAPTEKEFRAIYTARTELAKATPAPVNGAGVTVRPASDRAKEIEANLEKELGSERYHQFRTTSPSGSRRAFVVPAMSK